MGLSVSVSAHSGAKKQLQRAQHCSAPLNGLRLPLLPEFLTAGPRASCGSQDSASASEPTPEDVTLGASQHLKAHLFPMGSSLLLGALSGVGHSLHWAVLEASVCAKRAGPDAQGIQKLDERIPN